jgi:palmitoyl-protein thioesterase
LPTMKNNLAAVLLLVSSSAAAAVFSETQEEKLCQTPELYDAHPVLCHMLDRLYEDGDALAEELTQWAADQNLLVGQDWDFELETLESSASSKFPIVFAHGMGDSCFNSGFQNLVKHTSSMLNNVYSVCIPTGKGQKEDTTDGYFLNMDASVDVFAQAIQADPKLQDGFHAIGLSQGNNVIRGYIARYNEPAVNTFISINGVNGGTGALPNCFPSNEKGQSNLGGICSLLMEQASRRAYTDFAQQHSFQANYWRDPRPAQKEAYEEYSQLARWNNEREPFNQTLNDNFAKTKKFVWVMATKDEMVWPKEGEHWGAADPNAPLQRILPRNETKWYIQDSFGLKTAEEAGKNHYISFDGDHLQFTMDEYTDWVKTYLAEGTETNTAIQ